MSLCLKGRQVAHSESIRQKSAPQSNAQSVANSPQSSPSLISSPAESEQSPEVESVPESDAPLLKTTVEATKIAYQTPFQRAYEKALSDIKRGDNSPIRSQHYTLR